MLSLPNPKFLVEGYEGNRGAHMYRAIGFGEPENYLILDHLPSVTKKLDLIGGSKTGALMGWAVKESLKHVDKRLVLALSENLVVTRELVIDVLAEGRKRPEKVKDAAADLGTRIHAIIDKWIAGEREHLTSSIDEMVAFQNFQQFVAKMGLKFICGDLPVVSLKLKYGGRLDALAMIGNKLVLMDWKTSNAIRDDYALQVAGYRLALEETYGIRADRALVVRFDKWDPKVLDYKEVALGQATKTWKALVKFESEYYRRAWK